MSATYYEHSCSIFIFLTYSDCNPVTEYLIGLTEANEICYYETLHPLF